MPPTCPMCHASMYSMFEIMTHYCLEGEVVEETPALAAPQRELEA